jgi:hypothetical protein
MAQSFGAAYRANHSQGKTAKSDRRRIVKNLPDANGLLLILNDGNCFTRATCVYELGRKSSPKKGSRRAHPSSQRYVGWVYFSFRVRAAGEPYLFWMAGTIEPGKDTDLVLFRQG